ncbi:MAG: hypothetical protein AAF543_17955 [Pseudomonadota bacterium]
MPRAWNTGLPTALLLLGALVMLSGCNTISGTIGGVGRDISMIGNTISGVSGDCRHERCKSHKSERRTTRRVVSECVGRGCGHGHRSSRYERVSYRDRYAYRDRYSYRRDRHCC